MPAFGAIDSRLVVGLALCICGTLGKGTLRTYPSFRVPTPGEQTPRGSRAGAMQENIQGGEEDSLRRAVVAASR